MYPDCNIMLSGIFQIPIQFCLHKKRLADPVRCLLSLGLPEHPVATGYTSVPMRPRLLSVPPLWHTPPPYLEEKKNKQYQQTTLDMHVKILQHCLPGREKLKNWAWLKNWGHHTDTVKVTRHQFYCANKTSETTQHRPKVTEPHSSVLVPRFSQYLWLNIPFSCPRVTDPPPPSSDEHDKTLESASNISVLNHVWSLVA